MFLSYRWVKDKNHWRIDRRMAERIEVFRPVDEEFRISSPFGLTRTFTIDGEKITRVHKGVDFAVPERTKIYAMLAGKMHKVGFENPDNEKQGYGYRLIQEANYQGKRFWLYYGHLSWSLVHTNYEVREGEYIALSGNTGASTGPHLHTGIRENDTGDFCDLIFKKKEV